MTAPGSEPRPRDRDGAGPTGVAGDASLNVPLYPFLTAQHGDLDAVLAGVRRAAAERIDEIVALRRTVLERDADRLAACARSMAASFTAGGRLLAFANGVSATDAQELVRLFLCPRDARSEGVFRAMPAFALTTDVAAVTPPSTGVGCDSVFSRQVAALGRARDIAVGICTGGGSASLVRGFEAADRRGMLTVAITGHDGGLMAELDSVDYLFVVPSPSPQRVQEAQTTICHALWELTLREVGRG
ncbi:D-sedoheptulose 7-phosphate isomerase [Micromonospora pattaloongensis]|uniref:D-sedoheptulose 7-phosphate isomerase n=1 Tax=Micromonospora pattaloongensis TaxID=405436 RepID=A0A1H3RSH0_9ACTN|nr:SIS domain-containing protein [Micromonospora pattaloongensis]SDZ28662.1 D-sedoheptulose 7-phosphate isomerase [Micromonospora pattaloongensis]